MVGKARHDEALEYVAHHPNLSPGDLRYIPHSLGCTLFCTCLCTKRNRSVIRFIGLTLITSVALIIYRWAALKSETEMTSMLSREALFLLNNLLFMSILVVCFSGGASSSFESLNCLLAKSDCRSPILRTRNWSTMGSASLPDGNCAPSTPWGHSTVKTLGRALWKPAVGAIVIDNLYVLYPRHLRTHWFLHGCACHSGNGL